MSADKAASARASRGFAQRSDAAEWLDEPDRDPGELAGVLRDLARLNGATLGHLPVLWWLRRAIAAAPQGQPLRLVDAGCGYGDLLRFCDLQRHPLPHAVIGLAGKLANLHPTVIDDGQISVTRALTRSEWHARLDEAGIPHHGVTIHWFLFRYLIGRLR